MPITMRGAATRESRAWRLVLVAGVALAACNESRKAPAPTLVSLAIATPPFVMATGESREVGATGTYSDGTSAQVTDAVWSSSDAGVASVEAGRGLIRAVGSGTAVITAVHSPTGLSASVALTAREVRVLAFGAGDLPSPGQVDVGQRYLRVRGLTPGAFYEVALGDLEDDVDLEVGADLELAPERLSCTSQNVGLIPEACVAPASAAGELYLAADGQWTEQGSSFTLEVRAARPTPVRATVAFPAGFPVTGTVDATDAYFRVTGLTPSARYLVRISELSDDVDLEVYADAYEHAVACSSYGSGTAADACTATVGPEGELLVELDGDSTSGPSSFRLDVTAAP